MLPHCERDVYLYGRDRSAGPQAAPLLGGDHLVADEMAAEELRPLGFGDVTGAGITDHRVGLYSSVRDRPTLRSDWNSMTRTPPPTATVNSSRHRGLSSLAEPFQ